MSSHGLPFKGPWREKALTVSFPLIRKPVLSDEGPTLTTSLNLNYSPKDPVSK